MPDAAARGHRAGSQRRPLALGRQAMNRALGPAVTRDIQQPGDSHSGRVKTDEQEYTQMVNHSPRTALVLGCSSGIGRQTALRLHQAGLVVYATARRLGTLTGLAENGIHVLALDVTDEASMVAAVETIAASRGQVDVLVDCAGFELAGAVEEIPATEVPG